MDVFRLKDFGCNNMVDAGISADFEIEVDTGIYDGRGHEFVGLSGIQITKDELVQVIKIIPSIKAKIEKAVKEVIIELIEDNQDGMVELEVCDCGYGWRPKTIKSPTKRKEVPGLVYLLGVVGKNIVKIGITTAKKLRTRIDSIKTNTPHNLCIIGHIKTEDARGVEKKLHEMFKDKNLNREWFEVQPAVVIKEYEKFGEFIPYIGG